MKRILYIVFVALLSCLSIEVSSQDMAADIKQQIRNSMAAVCHDPAFLECVGVAQGKCTSTGISTFSSCEDLIPRTDGEADDESAFAALDTCITSGFSKGIGVSISKFDVCKEMLGSTPPVDQDQDQALALLALAFQMNAEGKPKYSSGEPSLDDPQVIKRYAELAYHIATNISSHHMITSDVGGDNKVEKCFYSGTKIGRAVGYTTSYLSFDKCHHANGSLLPVMNGVMIVKDISDDVSIVESKNILMTFTNNRTGYSVDGKLQEFVNSGEIVNIENIRFTYHLKKETWEHVVTSFRQQMSYVRGEIMDTTEEMFAVSLSGQPYGSLSAETLEPIRMGTGNDFGKIVSGKFKLTKGSRSFMITFMKPREILVEESGKESRRIDWYGNPTRIFSEIPYELKH
jgi:hypothetical protein